MDATALRALIRRVSGAMWGIGLKTKEEIADAFKLKPVETLVSSPLIAAMARV